MYCTAVSERHGLLEDTLVLLTSDNGPHMGNERSDVSYSTGVCAYV
jgi:arylsulfatase A-like enzyme